MQGEAECAFQRDQNKLVVKTEEGKKYKISAEKASLVAEETASEEAEEEPVEEEPEEEPEPKKAVKKPATKTPVKKGKR